uniref:Uncharacterized protein n=1 Tax=viral metagenome TaxID=1070528 RepID=A0A6C0F053_9ZZZZ
MGSWQTAQGEDAVSMGSSPALIWFVEGVTGTGSEKLRANCPPGRATVRSAVVISP